MTNGRIVGMPLPGANLPYLPLMRPGAGIGGAIEGTVLSDAILGISTHFHLKRTIPCTRHLGRCEGCLEWQRKAHWNGYIVVRESREKNYVVFQLTKFAVDGCPNLTREDFILRGSFIRLQRKGESEQGQVMMTFAEDRRQRTDNLKRPDLTSSLARMWGMSPEGLRRAVGWKDGAA